MRVRRNSCPKCTGDLYLDQDFDERRILPPEWVCLQCGWRQAIKLRTPQRLAG